MNGNPGPGPALPSGGFCVWMTGLPSAGKTSIGRALLTRLRALGYRAELLDGDEIRSGLSSDLGFDRAGRESHAARVTYVAKVLVRNDVIPIVALISPYRTSRARARAEIGRFVETYVDTPIAVCEARDVKGLYRKARSGAIREMTGVDDPYEPPEHPEIVLHTTEGTAEQAADGLFDELVELGWISAPEPGGAPRGAQR